MTAQSRNFNVAAILVAATFCALPPTVRAADPQEYYRQASEHFTAGRWEQAAAEFRRVIDEADAQPKADAAAMPLVEPARFYLAESLVRGGKSAEAIEALRSFIAASQDEALLPIARYRLGESCYLADRGGEAREAFQTLIDEATKSGTSPATMPRTLYYLGELSTRDGDHAAAAAWFGTLTAAYPQDDLYEAAALGRIEALLRSHDLAAAWAAARAFCGDSAAPAKAEYLAAQTLEALTLHADAAAAYDRYLARAAIDAAERDVAIYDSAWNLRKLERPADAAARFDELVRSQPKSRFRADAAYRAAEFHFGAGRLDEAKSRLGTAQAAADADILPHVLALQLQVALAALDRPGAEAVVEALAKQCPQHEVAKNALYWQGEIAYRAEAWDDAAERFAAAMAGYADKRSPWFAAAVARRIESLAQAGNWPDTIAAVEQSRTQLPPGAPRFELDYLAGRAHAARAEFREAREAYGLVLADDQATGSETAVLARFMTAESYFHQRDYAAALTEYARVVAQPGFPEWRAASLLQSGKCQEQLGKQTEAMTHYERLIAEFSDSPYAADAARRREAAFRQAEVPAGNVQRK